MIVGSPEGSGNTVREGNVGRLEQSCRPSPLRHDYGRGQAGLDAAASGVELKQVECCRRKKMERQPTEGRTVSSSLTARYVNDTECQESVNFGGNTKMMKMKMKWWHIQSACQIPCKNHCAAHTTSPWLTVRAVVSHQHPSLGFLKLGCRDVEACRWCSIME